MKFQKFFIFMIIACPLAIFIPFLSKFAFPPGSPYSDLLITHYPNAIFLKNTLTTFHEVPLWSNTILSGYPFAADPLSGLWYPPGWFALILPIPFGFNGLVLAHILFSGIGAYFLMRALKMDVFPSMLGAITFELFPKLFGHYASGHITLLYAVSWTPWLLWAEIRRLTSNSKWSQVLPGIIFGMILLADVRWSGYSAILWLSFSLYFCQKPIRMMQYASGVFFQLILGGLIAGPILLPLYEYTQLSTRSLLTSNDNLSLSLSPVKLLGFLVPEFWGNAETVVYPGGLGILLFVFSLIVRKLRKENIFWIVCVLGSIILSLGGNVPLINGFFQLPGFNFLRVPTRFIFITGLALSVITASGIGWLAQSEKKVKSNPDPGIVLTGIVSLIAFLAIGLWGVTGVLSLEFSWAAVFLILFGGMILLKLNRKPGISIWYSGLFVFIILDLATVSFSHVSFQSPATINQDQENAANYLDQFQIPFRIYSPSYSISQNIAADHNFQLTDGIDPLQLITYEKYMRAATGIPSSGYSVTLPPFKTGNPNIDNEIFLPDAEKLGLLNVKYVVSKFPLIVRGLTKIKQLGDIQVYENLGVFPRAWVQESYSEVPIVDQYVKSIEITPNRVSVEAAGPGLLVLSEIFYPGWKAEIGGKPAQIDPVYSIFRGVRLNEGIHQIEIVFRPLTVYIGLSLAVIGWAAIILFITWKMIKRW